MPREKRVLKYGDPDYAKHDPYSNYRSGVITGAGPTDEIRTHDGQLHIHAQGQWHNVHPPGGGSLPHGAYGIRWTLRPDEVERAGLDKIAMREPRRTVMTKSSALSPQERAYLTSIAQDAAEFGFTVGDYERYKEPGFKKAARVAILRNGQRVGTVVRLIWPSGNQEERTVVYPAGVGPGPHSVIGLDLRWLSERVAPHRAEENPPMRQRRVMSRRQPSLPGFPDIPEEIEIRIPTMPWTQIGGDMDPGAYGGLIATADGEHIELLQIQPVREYVGDKEAAEVGFPFWTKEAYFDLADLDLKNDDVKSALDYIGMTLEALGEDPGGQKAAGERGYTPEERALVIAEALLDYGRGDEGPSGWSEDLPGHDVKWWTDKVVPLPEYVADEDEVFKDDVLGYSEIRSNLEAEVQKMVDESAAQGWSQLGDQTVIDLDDQGYDGQSAFVIAAFGNEPMIAVNTDTTFAADFAREIGVPTTKSSVYIWSETGTRELEAWLEKNGYETVHRMGGTVPSTEGYATARFVIEAVAREMDLDEDVVRQAAEGIDGWPKDRGQGDQEIPGSTDGDTTVWAKKIASDEDEELEEPRRSRRTRRR
jgi:hypothetical protein